jgi:hypothetical protein
MSPISFIGGLGKVVGSWCFYLGVLLCVPIAMWLHELGNALWFLFVSVPTDAVGLGGG